MKKDDDWIEEQNKKVIHYLWTIFISMVIAMLTTIAVSKYIM